MRLSEAIRLGATMKPKATGTMHGAEGTCAIGAAFDAIGRLDEATPASLGRYFEGVRPGRYTSPAVEWFTSDMGEVIMDLNDVHQWTRERIADWVELQEGPTAPEELPDPIPQPEEAPLEVA